MKKLARTIAFLLVVLLFAFGAFYFWAQRANWSPDKHTELLHTEIRSPIDDSTFSLLTYNIGYLSGMTNNEAVKRKRSLFDNNLQTAQSLIKQLQPDIACFQEIDYESSRSYEVNQEEAIAKPDYTYTARAVNWDKKYVAFPYWPISMHFGKIVSGQSVLSKYPIEDQQIDTLVKVSTAPFFYNAFYLERLAQIIKVKIDKRDMIVINVHLEAFDRETRRIHTLKVLELYKKYSRDYPVILCGDFNSSPDEQDPTIDILLQAGIATADLLPSSIKTGNFDKTYNSLNPSERLDYIFYTADKITLLDSRLIKEAGQISDHLPLWAQFRLK